MRHTRVQKTSARPLFADWKLAAASIGAFWLIYAILAVGRAFLSDHPGSVLAQRLPMIGTGVVLTCCIYFAIQAVDEGARIRVRAAIAAIASIVAAIAQALLIITMSPLNNDPGEEYRIEAREGAIITQRGNEVIIERTSGEQPMIFTLPKLDELGEYEKLRIAADAAVIWLFFFAAWSAVYLAAVSSHQVADTRRRLAAAKAEAHAAQVRALRYQVNPHFLFNTLNSLSSLVMTGRNEQAESMLIALSTFFRTSLSLDPNAAVTLEQEIKLQQLYLDIEQRRFPDRLKVEIALPEELKDLTVPALILQPLVENSIKYGVGRTRHPVTIEIGGALRPDGRAAIHVFNSAPAGDEPRPTPLGTGTGLNNVSERLKAQYGSRAECRFGPVDGGYRVDLIIPREESPA